MKKKVVAFTTVAILSSTIASNALADTYKVQQGDTLSYIAKKYSLSVSELKALNNLSSDLIYVDQTLNVAATAQVKVPVIDKAPAKPAATTMTTAPVVSKSYSSAPAAGSTVYTVVKGDTLGKIANQHKIPLADLMKLNNLSSYMIYPGQVLKVSQSASPAPAEKVDKAPVPPKESAPALTSTGEYVVKSGDTLGHISARNGMTVSELKELNALSSDLIYVGQKLKLRAGSTSSGNSTSTVKPITADKGDNISTPGQTVKPEASKGESLYPVSSQSLINEATDLLGTPYAWAGNSPEGFDCSGFIHYVLNESGTSMTRQSTEGYYSRSYYINEPQPGDFVFFENTYKAGISHMGIYLGNNEFIHASSSKGVIISSLDEPYYESRFDGFKRLY